MITSEPTPAAQTASCAWCYSSTDNDRALFKVGVVESPTNPWPASNRWACSVCTPLVEAHEVATLAMRALALSRRNGNHYAGLAPAHIADAFRRVDAAIERRVEWDYAEASP